MPRCNCDSGELVWTYDDGELTDRGQLPVTKLNFGNFYEVWFLVILENRLTQHYANLNGET